MQTVWGTARSKRTRLTRTAEKRKAARVQSFYNGLIGNGHKPFEVSFVGQADVVVCALCGKYVQEKRKSIVQRCSKGISEAGRRVLDRIANGKHPDRLSTGRVTTCFDVASKTAGELLSLVASQGSEATEESRVNPPRCAERCTAMRL